MGNLSHRAGKGAPVGAGLTFRRVHSTSSSLWPFSGASPMNRITAGRNTVPLSHRPPSCLPTPGWTPPPEAMARAGRGKGAPPLLPHLREGVVVTKGHSAASLLARGPGCCPTPTPRNMSVAILLRLLSLNSRRESWSGVCRERNWVMTGGKVRGGEPSIIKGQ